MLPALIEIHNVLIEHGYSAMEAADLITRLMQEEAFAFVENNRRFKENTVLN